MIEGTELCISELSCKGIHIFHFSCTWRGKLVKLFLTREFVNGLEIIFLFLSYSWKKIFEFLNWIKKNFCFSFLLKKQTEVNSDVNFLLKNLSEQIVKVKPFTLWIKQKGHWLSFIVQNSIEKVTELLLYCLYCFLHFYFLFCWLHSNLIHYFKKRRNHSSINLNKCQYI